MCPMRFNRFPLDQHTCKFMIGSTNYDDTRMMFSNEKLDYDPDAGNTILDYKVVIEPLQVDDTILAYGDAGNYSITGFEMTLTRNVAKYVYYSITYGLPTIIHQSIKRKPNIKSCVPTTFWPFYAQMLLFTHPSV
jgi:hypothetical protein